MKRIPMVCVGFLLFSVISSTSGTLSPTAGDHPAYRHAYYLFLAGTPTGCEDCYVPLLITTGPLEELAKRKGHEECVLIITYERDSVWHDEGIVPLEFSDIEAAPRIVHLRGRKYRYQEIPSSELLHLLENPMGTIPISRPALPNPASPVPIFQELISAFRNTK